jgi:anti-sigma28 factor (negative regulator of flagellin synthesis)
LTQSTPDVREGLVEQVRNLIENGTYNVKAEHVADKILSGNLIDQIF